MIDILFTADAEMKNGDFALGESANQHVKHILIASKGEFKSNPELGVDIEKMLATEQPVEFLIEGKKNLEYDGMKVNDISITEKGTLNVDANYNT